MTILTGDFAAPSAVAALARQSPDHSLSAKGDTAPEASALTADAQLYLRHVEKGETIRSLAREAGCHASTILRRIRRFEAKRDDPLVDGALSQGGRDVPRLDPGNAIRVLRRLAEPGAIMAAADGMDKAIVSRDDIRTAILDRKLAEAMALRGWVIRIGPESGRIQRYMIAPAGREALRRTLKKPRRGGMPRADEFANASPVDGNGLAEAPAGFDHAEKHRVWDNRVIQDPEDGRRRRRRVNIAESPLLMLARRKMPDGQPFLSAEMVAAAERIREDFELAQMGPRVTQNWDGFMTAGIDVSRSSSGYRGGSESARDRVAVALRDLGPGMGDIVLRVCCFLEGVEMTERRLGWSARSGKVVLRLALMRLARHYEEAYGKGSPLIG